MTKDNAWFRPKRYGLGWSPATWQGWVLTVVGSVAVIGTLRSSLPHWARGAAAIAILVIFTIIAAMRSSGTPRWRWGKD